MPTNSAPRITIAVRGKDGSKGVFRVQDAAIRNHEQAIALTRAELPDAEVVLASVPKRLEAA